MQGVQEFLTKWLIDNEIGNTALRVILFVIPILIIVPGLIWWERRLLSWMQDRIGPNRVGPKGLLQPIADGVKLFFKEDITPVAVDRLVYFIAPALALFPAFAVGGTLPWSPDFKLSPVADVEIGVLYVLAISSLGVYGVVLAGYASNNKYSLMGGLRSSAQLISYELAMGMAVAAVCLAAGSLKMTEIINFQMTPILGFQGVPIANWLIFTPYGFIAAIIFLICIIAETNRAPFDLPEAENELIAGYHTEYSSMKFAVFFMGEYAAMFIFGGIFGTLFLGGYHALPIVGTESIANLPGVAPAIFLSKCVLGITFFIWLRATLPRLRYDQLMNLGWKTMLPVAVLNFVIVGVWILAGSIAKDSGMGQNAAAGAALGAWALAFFAAWLIYAGVKRVTRDSWEKQLGKRTVELKRSGITMVDPTKAAETTPASS
jgi:NADH-quinone oxidoreductase subunit H